VKRAGFVAALLVRLFGMSLLSLSVICRAANSAPSGQGVSSHAAAMLLYNIGVAGLLVYARAILGMFGFGLWPAVAAHAFFRWLVHRGTGATGQARRAIVTFEPEASTARRTKTCDRR
jgi:hypothetical protein